MEDLHLQPGEHVLMAVRKHWLIYVGAAIPFAVFAYLPVLALELFAKSPFVTTPWAHYVSLENPWILFVLGAWWLFVWMGAFSNFMRYFLDVWIITNKRIIDVEQIDFFSREVTSLFLDHIEDVTVHETGFFHTLFGFGNLMVQSAGAADRTELPGISHPKDVRDLLMHQAGKFEERPQHVIVDKK
ncbi:MAG: PH domain-containing protein [Candidatus Pacebacteria bacterium]|nr:PH domain-containing protein [Candidatus Paceibacterota bacterium]